MVDDSASRPGRTPAELAAHYHRTAATIRGWLAEPGAPAPIGKRGKAREYDPHEIEAYFRRTHLPAEPDAPANPGRLLTLAEAAAHCGIAYSTARAYASRAGQWPEPDEIRGGVKLWRAGTIEGHRAHRKRMH